MDVERLEVDAVLVAWARLAPVVDALYASGAAPRGAAEARRVVELVRDRGARWIRYAPVSTAARVLAAIAGVGVATWLADAAHEARTPRRKPPPAVDLLLRLQGVDARWVQLIEDRNQGIVRCTIATHHGDVVSHESGATANAIAGAISLAEGPA